MKEYAIVDIETTGGYSGGNNIIEVAIYTYDGHHIQSAFHSLINPNKAIPKYISGLTGITGNMLTDAPTFPDIAEQVHQILKGKIFVAHSANFDYSFIRKEFKDAGISFEEQKLCTVKAARKIFPGLRSYSLGRICDHLGIRIEDRHRAHGDAKATVELLKQLLEADKNQVIEQLIKRNGGEWALPDHISKEKYDSLPESTGVYYFYDEKGKIIYIGKAVNIKSRIKSHFSSNGDFRKNRYWSRINDVRYEETGSELIALILEAQEIKKHLPEFNKALKRKNKKTGLISYEDRDGYLRLAITDRILGQPVLMEFKNVAEGRMFLMEKMEQLDLCGKLTGLQPSKKSCYQYGLGNCRGACLKEEAPDLYNLRIEELIKDIKQTHLSYWMIDQGKDETEYALVLVEKGRYRGHGYVPVSDFDKNSDNLMPYIDSHPDNSDITSIIQSFQGKPEVRFLYMDNS